MKASRVGDANTHFDNGGDSERAGVALRKSSSPSKSAKLSVMQVRPKSASPGPPDPEQVPTVTPEPSSSELKTTTRRRAARTQRIDYIAPSVKYLMFVFNFLFWLGGMLVTVVGVWIIIDKSGPINEALDIVFDPAIAVVICGVLLYVLGFLGCVGSLRENMILLKAYYIGLMCIVVLEYALVAIIATLYYVPRFRHKVRWLDPSPVLKLAIRRYQDDENLEAMIDAMQRKFKCCGYSFNEEGYKDWGHNMYYNCSKTNRSVQRCGVPYSCCKPVKNQLINIICGHDVVGKSDYLNAKRIYLQGCLKGFGDWLENHMRNVAILFFAVLIPEIMAIKLARDLTLSIELQKEQW